MEPFFQVFGVGSPPPTYLPSAEASLMLTFPGTVVSSCTLCLGTLSHAAHPAEGILVQRPEAASKEVLFACVLKMGMIIIEDVSRIMSGIRSRAARVASHPVFYYKITFCSAVPLGLFGVGHGSVRDWGQSQQCLQTQEECQQDMAKSKYDLCDFSKRLVI